jgi:hypothetical protein
VKNRTKRNDPCPCGSGKKYKQCCGKQIKIRQIKSPEPINYHLEMRNGTWQKKPGRLMVTLITKDVDDECVSIRNLFEILKNKRSSDDYQKIAEHLRNCEHKLYAVWHHYKSIERHMQEKIQNFQKGYIPSTGADVENLDYNLIYGTEAFLFQVVSNLDLITQLLGRFIPELKSFRTFKSSNKIAGGKVIQSLLRTNHQDLYRLFEESRKKWIQKVVEMRVTISHYSGLKNFRCFRQRSYQGDEISIIEYPKMPSGQSLTVFCDEIFSNLCDLYREIFCFIAAQLE